MRMGLLCRSLVLSVAILSPVCISNPHAKRLYDDLLHDYNRLIRPVQNFTETLTVNLGLKLSQLIDVNLKDQVMTTNVWVDQNWNDYKLKWNPIEYGGVKTLYVPSERIWLPDIVLYNNADGKYEVRLMTKAELKYTGDVKWTPPAIYKSSCEINVEWFPFDEQICDMKFGSWTYDARQVDLKHMHQEPGNNVVEIGIDLTEFYLSVEWDILDVPATKNVENYNPEMDENEHHEDDDDEVEDKLLTDITFILTMRRKTLFYTVNLIIPCVGISFLTVLVFYLPADSGEKVTLCISILLSLTVFFLLLAEIIPPTSLAVPLLSKYLLFSMLLITLSIFITVGVLNIHFRSPSTHIMSPWVKHTFLTVLPKFLLMRRPHYSPRYLKNYEDTAKSEPPAYIDNNTKATQVGYRLPAYGELESPKFVTSPKFTGSSKFSQETIACDSDGKTGQDTDYIKTNGTVAHFGGLSDDALSLSDSVSQHFSPEVENALLGVQFIAQHIRDNDKENEVMEDWKYMAMVLDRLFLWLFTLTCLMGTGFIILRAPSLYDTREPIDARHTTIGN